MNRDEARALLQEHMKEDAMLKHSLATEAIMRALAVRLHEDPERWGLTGLLHDLDFECTRDAMASHGKQTAELLSGKLDEACIHAIMAHNEATGAVRRERLDHALACAESITGLIVATALVYPDRRITSVKPSSVTKRMRQTAFARAVNRENIKECERLGLSLDEFVSLSIQAMADISNELGL